MTPTGARARPSLSAIVLAVAFAAVAAQARAAAAVPPLPTKPPHGDAAVCFVRGVSSRPLWFRATDGRVLAGAVYGKGARGVVLAPQSGGSHCGWLSFARRLAKAGYHVLAFDLRGRGQSPWPGAASVDRKDLDVVGAVRALRRLGARSVVAAGASLGGAAVLAAGPALGGIASGLISFSGEPDLGPAPAGARPFLPQIRLPLLVVAGRDDPYANAQTSQEVIDAAGSADKTLLVYPGDWHGWALVGSAPTAADCCAAVIRWLAAHT